MQAGAGVGSRPGNPRSSLCPGLCRSRLRRERLPWEGPRAAGSRWPAGRKSVGCICPCSGLMRDRHRWAALPGAELRLLVACEGPHSHPQERGGQRRLFRASPWSGRGQCSQESRSTLRTGTSTAALAAEPPWSDVGASRSRGALHGEGTSPGLVSKSPPEGRPKAALPTVQGRGPTGVHRACSSSAAGDHQCSRA